MARYIDADEFGTWLANEYFTFGRIKGIPPVITAVHRFPQADVAPVIHAHWIITDIKEYEQAYGGTLFVPEYQCSCCGYWYESYIRADEPKMPKDADFPNYCENCGAKMDEEVTDGQ